ncbi:MAG: NUDIX domain-containing protein [Candidatus Jordarchaeum sp.]|uniref:NUDIX domain-containing protein n=1 Tax=Candidatus Jordarchaeum sp. TaxID=2823881 RepID=UPI0040492C32
MSASNTAPRTPLIAVDAIIIKDDCVVLIKRKNPPFQDHYALPGGFVEIGEYVEEAVIREAKEETGLEVRVERFSGIYDDPERDPRGHVISIAYICDVVGGKLRADSDAKDVICIPIKEIKKIKLAFDHTKILLDAGII